MREFDNQRVSTYMRCPRRYYFRHVKHLAPDMHSYKLSFGLAWHEAMDSLWKYWDIELAMEAFISEWGTTWDETVTYPRSTGRARDMLIEYIGRYKDLHAQNYKLLEIETGFRVPLFDDVLYTGRIDKVIEDRRERVIVVDHKTTFSIKGSWADSFSPNNQVDGYEHAGFMTYGDRFWGVMIDGALVQKTKIDFLRIPLQRQYEQLDIWAFEVEQWIRGILEEENKLEKGEYAFPKRTVACSDFGGCPYRDLCKRWTRPWEHDEIPIGYKIDPWEPIEGGSTKDEEKGGTNAKH